MSDAAETFPTESVQTADCGTIVYSPGGRYGPRYQSDFQLVLLHTGHLKVTIDDASHVVTPGNAVLLRPGHWEYFEFASDQETWHRWIAVAVADADATKWDELPFILPISSEMNKLTDLMLEMKPGASADSLRMKCLGLAALYQFSHEAKCEDYEENIHVSVALAKRMIHERYAQNWTLVDLAMQANVTPEHLIRLFHTYENTTPIKYLWHYRVRQAAEMLAVTGYSVAEIAERCGFKSTIHFSKCLKQRTGKSPSEIRRDAWQRKEAFRLAERYQF
ncbi:helix-turn-helix transcriptional regulator [Paenibacillus sp. MWE-103]|uniref:Helix-turn-helix transcriptional regulator n=1 Tax=Paenibacillus artemisiicola TaxID=1172618 RepID=A0ABS3WFD1_9BACL|nr:AraC family transcriptional regulator [Paenibacillus artemisiicola]MBO7747022.1 helix-turn-helix transcriptional regulator [Paenibacillus artemisiicola]